MSGSSKNKVHVTNEKLYRPGCDTEHISACREVWRIVYLEKVSPEYLVNMSRCETCQKFANLWELGQ